MEIREIKRISEEEAERRLVAMRDNMFAFAGKRLPRQDVADAVQEASYRAWEMAPSFDDLWGVAGFQSWVFKILERVCWEMKREGRREEARADVSLGACEGFEGELLDRLEREEDRERFWAAVERAKLSARQVECLLGRLSGKSDRETGEGLGISQQAVSARIGEALAKIRSVSVLTSNLANGYNSDV
jgi:RNA polymerase sigma factor (sigma-70 family)